MTSLVRWVQPPDSRVPQPGHCSTTCSIRWVASYGSGPNRGGGARVVSWAASVSGPLWVSDRVSGPALGFRLPLQPGDPFL